MANPRVLLARCAPHGGSYSTGTGGPEWTPADVAHAAAHIRHPAGRALVLYLWADHVESWPAVESALLVEASKLAAINGWRITRPGALTGLVRLAVHEIGSPRHCPRCNGSGEHGGKQCQRCGGEGALPYTERAQAFVSGLSRRALREYAGWHDDVSAMVRDIERRARDDMRRALR